MIDKPLRAPNCFGSIVVFCGDSEVCMRCNSFTECEQASSAALSELKQVDDVRAILERHKRATKQAEKRKELVDQKVAKRAREIQDTFDVDMTEAIAESIEYDRANPFSGTGCFLEYAVDVTLNNDALGLATTATELAACYVEKLQMTAVEAMLEARAVEIAFKEMKWIGD